MRGERSEGHVEVQVRRFDPEAPIPAYAHPGDAGADLTTRVDVRLGPGERSLVPTGIGIALPEGYVGLVHPRSGLAARHGVSVVNAPGTVDAGYRGEIQVVLVNLDPRRPVHLSRGDRIAQLVVQQVEAARFRAVTELPDSARGVGGHGSTGGFGVLHPESPESPDSPGISDSSDSSDSPADPGRPDRPDARDR